MPQLCRGGGKTIEMRRQDQARYLYAGGEASSIRSRYSRSIRLSMRFLIMFTSGLNWLAKIERVSATRF